MMKPPSRETESKRICRKAGGREVAGPHGMAFRGPRGREVGGAQGLARPGRAHGRHGGQVGVHPHHE
eukprot:4485299-Alexandrium_andersonii.AAC.1